MSEVQSSINPTLAQLDHLPDSAHIRPKPCAQALGVSISTFWRLVRSNKIPVKRLTERTTVVELKALRAFMNSSVEG